MSVKECADDKSEAALDLMHSKKHRGILKKTSKKRISNSDGDYFKGFMFSVGIDGQYLYKKNNW